MGTIRGTVKTISRGNYNTYCYRHKGTRGISLLLDSSGGDISVAHDMALEFISMETKLVLLSGLSAGAYLFMMMPPHLRELTDYSWLYVHPVSLLNGGSTSRDIEELDMWNQRLRDLVKRELGVELKPGESRAFSSNELKTLLRR